MTTSRFTKKLMLCGMASAALLALPAQAVFTINVTQSGSDVVMSGSGSLNTTGLTPLSTGGSCVVLGLIAPSIGQVCIGSTGTYDYYALTGPGSFGTGGITLGSSASGPELLISSAEIGIPSGYTSGAPITNSVTFTGQTLSSLGVTPGSSYTWTLPAPSNDTVVLNVTAPQANPVPTLGEYGMLALASLLAMSGIAYARKRQG